jgi:hypothetical protein
MLKVCSLKKLYSIGGGLKKRGRVGRSGEGIEGEIKRKLEENK